MSAGDWEAMAVDGGAKAEVLDRKIGAGPSKAQGMTGRGNAAGRLRQHAYSALIHRLLPEGSSTCLRMLHTFSISMKQLTQRIACTLSRQKGRTWAGEGTIRRSRLQQRHARHCGPQLRRPQPTALESQVVCGAVNEAAEIVILPAPCKGSAAGAVPGRQR